MLENYFSNRLKTIKNNFEELIEYLTEPERIIDCEELPKIIKKKDYLAKIVELDYRIQKAKVNLTEAKQILNNSAEEPEIQDLARVEVSELSTKISQMSKQLNILLLPRDPDDGKNVFIEIFAHANEENLLESWLCSLAEMYSRYSKTQKWRCLLLSESSELINKSEFCHQVVLKILGEGVYGKLKCETGIHLLMAKSALFPLDQIKVTIKVMPEVDSEIVKIDPVELKIYNRYPLNEPKPHTSVRKVPWGVKIVHQPTAIVVICTEERSELQNLEVAMSILRAKLNYEQLTQPSKIVYSEIFWELSRQKEIVRVYDYQNNRIKDLRLGQDFNLDNAMEGNIDKIIESCISQDQQERLAVVS